MLINRLTDHALGTLDKPMDASQVQAAKILLGKVVPDVSSVEWVGDLTSTNHTTHKVDPDQLAKLVAKLDKEY